jgi:hypothetical protein
MACRDAVVGAPTDAVTELCSRLEDCFEFAKCSEIRPRVEGASAKEAATFIEGYDRSACLATCSSALACLDVDPLCTPPDATSDACERRADCCGWTSLGSDCVASRCCAGRGQRCTAGDECCEGRCTEANDERLRCGGVVCSAVGTSCSTSGECCSQLCQDAGDGQGGRCAVRSCGVLDAACESNADCCTEVELGNSTVSLACVQGRCGLPAQECDLGSPCTAAEDCCALAEKPLVCYAASADLPGVCGSPDCIPEKTPCTLHSNCCEGQACLANDAGLRLCTPSQCTKDGGSCSTAADACCEGLACVDGVCLDASSIVCEVALTHCPLQTGAPMDRDALAVGLDALPTACLNREKALEIPEQDVFCGCVAWDEACVLAVLQACGPVSCQ